MNVSAGVIATGEGRGMAGGELVVREDKVPPSSGDGHRDVEKILRDDRALDVPAGPAVAQFARPRRLPRPRAHPQHRIERIAFPFALRIPTALCREFEHDLAIQQTLLSQVPGGGCGGRRTVEIHVVTEPVCRAGIEKPHHRQRDRRDHVRDRDIVIRRDHAEREHVPTEELDLLGCEVAPVDVDSCRAFQERIVDIRHILHVAHVVPGVEPESDERVEGHIGCRVADVSRVVRRDAAHIEPGEGVRAGLDDSR